MTVWVVKKREGNSLAVSVVTISGLFMKNSILLNAINGFFWLSSDSTFLHFCAGGMSGLQNMMKQLQQGAGGLGNLMGGFGGKSWEHWSTKIACENYHLIILPSEKKVFELYNTHELQRRSCSLPNLFRDRWWKAPDSSLYIIFTTVKHNWGSGSIFRFRNYRTKSIFTKYRSCNCI